MFGLKNSVKGISNLALLILIVIFAVIGAVLSYMWTEAYYIEAGFKVPEEVITVTISNVTFPIQNASYFNITVLAPSFSYDDAYISQIILGNISTENPNMTLVIPNENVEPNLPYPLTKSEEVTLKCNQNWGKFAGKSIYVAVLLQEGSGATFPFQTKKVKLEIIDIEIDSSISVERFNVTIRNADYSPISLNITEVLINSTTISSQNITIFNENASLPLQLSPGESETLICNWNLWKKGALGSSLTITVHTAQGYSAINATETISEAASLNISDVVFVQPHTSYFNITVVNELSSPHFVDVDRVTIRNGTQTFKNITIMGGSTRIYPGYNFTYKCIWSWDNFTDKEVEVTVFTTQGFYVNKSVYIPATFGIPVADFDYSPIPSYTGNVTFNATKSYDTYGSIVGYSWDFGDGTNDTGEVVTHNYVESNNFSVSLTVTDNDGLTDTKSFNLTILNQLPIALFSESAETAYVGDTISFNASTSYDPDGLIVVYFWDFGDGTNDTGIVVNHSFSTNGTFTVTLIITDDDGGISSTNATKTIMNVTPSILSESFEVKSYSFQNMLWIQPSQLNFYTGYLDEK
jgi:PKD repeat protein